LPGHAAYFNKRPGDGLKTKYLQPPVEREGGEEEGEGKGVGTGGECAGGYSQEISFVNPAIKSISARRDRQAFFLVRMDELY
jgi:hypothetical protein